LEGSEIDISITTSVPVECVGSNAEIIKLCTQTLKIAQPVYQGNPSDKCVNNIQEESMVFNMENCGVTFSTNNWQMPINLTVTGYADNVYNIHHDRTSHIRLKTNKDTGIGSSGVWDNVNIPDIQVRLYRFFSKIKPKPNCTELETHLPHSSDKTSHIITQCLVYSP
jgi:hypothetical protein